MIVDVIPQPLVVGRNDTRKLEIKKNEEYELFHYDKEGE